jgi:hypothetical protein
MLPIIRGTGTPLQQEASQSYDPIHGWLYSYHFKGANVTQVLQLQTDYANLGMPSRLVAHQGGMVSLDVEDPTQQFTVDSWELVGSEINIDGFSHPTLLAIFANSPNAIASLRQDLENNKTVTQLKSDLAAVGLSAGNVATVSAFYSLAQAGSTEFRVAQYVVRHTSNLPNRGTTAQAIYTHGVNQIYTPAQGLADFTASAWSPAMPTVIVNTIEAIPAPADIDRYQWGWLKGSPTFTSAANNRVDVKQEYTLYQWSTDYYTPLVSSS